MSTLKGAIEALLGRKKAGRYNSQLVGNRVVFSQFGKDVYASDIARTALRRKCEEMSKCKLASVIVHNEPRHIELLDDDLNAVFRGRINPLCGLKDFLWKYKYLMEVNRNCFIYWAYDEVPIPGTGRVKRVTRGFYPIEHANVRIYYEGEMRVELASTAGEIVLDLPYSDVIHVRKDYGANRYLGGNASGRAEHRDLLKNLQTVHVITEAIPKALEASLSLKGILSMKTVADFDKKEISREEFERHLFDSKYGIVATDYEADFTPININATDIPSNIMTYIREEILAPMDVSLPIYLGNWKGNEYASFFQTALEGDLMALVEAMKLTVFTPRQLAFGHEIKYYDRVAQSLTFEERRSLAEMTKDDGLLSRCERRELLGYEPDGGPDRVSLNYIDKSIANQYQLSVLAQPSGAEKLKPKEKEKQNGNGQHEDPAP